MRMAVDGSTSPDSESPFSFISSSSCSRSTTRNLPLLTSSVTKTSWAAVAPPWNHHWLSALFLNSRTAMRGLVLPPLDAARVRPGAARIASSRAPQMAKDETRFIGKPPSGKNLFLDFTPRTLRRHQSPHLPLRRRAPGRPPRRARPCSRCRSPRGRSGGRGWAWPSPAGQGRSPPPPPAARSACRRCWPTPARGR